jgi:hypothetical protein
MRTRTWPWFVLAALLLIVALAALSGTPQAVVGAAAVFVFLGACIRMVGLLVRDNEVGSKLVARRGLVGGVAGGFAGWMAEDSRVRRSRKAAERASSEPR